MAYVSGRRNNENTLRPVYDGAAMSFPRLSDSSRSEIYTNETGNGKSPLGFISDVPKTFALYESSYPLINEAGVAFGESTTMLKAGIPEIPSRFARPLFSAASLMAVALERCATARCAVETMGSLVSDFGFFPESPGTGEAITVIDSRASWIFEVVSIEGALWVAQRVPDDHVAVVANSMVIDFVDCEDSEFFICSPFSVD
jgi:dipeptidase